MNELTYKEKDLLVMKLLHYFITEKGYNPIILHGVNNEIWLENMNAPYRIVRIMMGYIHNDEQYDFDIFKTKKIMNKIKVKTFSLKMNLLSIFIDLGEYVNLKSDDKIECVNIKDEKEINVKSITAAFPDITKKMIYNEDGVELFTKITNDINEKNKTEAKKAEEVLGEKKPYVTYSLILINIIIFILMYIFGGGSTDIPTLYKFGAITKVSVVGFHEYYRIITAAFLHIGILHLAVNMYALRILGMQVENFFGHYKFGVIYLYSAIFGSLMSLIFMSDSSIAAGASGAIFGLLGAMLYFGYHYRSYLGNSLLIQIFPIILLNLFIGFSISGIDSAAHIGGLIGGLLIANAVGIKYKTTKFEIINGAIVSVLALAFLVYMIFFR